MATLPKEVEVLIVGAGPVGMTAANLLGRYGVDTLVVDKEMEIFALPRAIGTDNDGLRVLQAAGLPRDAFELITMPRLEMHTPHMGKVVEAQLGGHINSFPAQAMFFQPDMEAALHETVAAHNTVRLERGVEATAMRQDADAATISLKTRDGQAHEIAALYVIAADGANSKFRDWLGESFTGKDYAEEWLIVDVIGRDREKHGPSIDHVMFYCNPHRPYPHMPAPGGRERWEFKIKKKENPADFMKDEVIQDLLKDWYPNRDANIERKAIYKFQARAVKNFAHGRVFLA
ncbi:MAG: FAD-dependent monooxygenase, partial [Alphaproteobacteria bacterium]